MKINFKTGFHRVFIILSIIISLLLTNYLELHSVNSPQDLWLYLIPIFLGLCFYSIYYVILWIISGFTYSKQQTNKGLIIALFLMNIIIGIIAIERQYKIVELNKEKQELQNKFYEYKSRIEGNYSGWTIEEIKDLFNTHSAK